MENYSVELPTPMTDWSAWKWNSGASQRNCVKFRSIKLIKTTQTPFYLWGLAVGGVGGISSLSSPQSVICKPKFTTTKKAWKPFFSAGKNGVSGKKLQLPSAREGGGILLLRTDSINFLHLPTGDLRVKLLNAVQHRRLPSESLLSPALVFNPPCFPPFLSPFCDNYPRISHPSNRH